MTKLISLPCRDFLLQFSTEKNSEAKLKAQVFVNFFFLWNLLNLSVKLLFTLIPQAQKGSFTVGIANDFCAEVSLELSPEQMKIFKN